MSKKRGLGTGLSELLSDINTTPAINNLTENQVTTTDSTSANGRLSQLPVDRIMSGRYQPRKHMDQGALQELADSIRAQGIIQPIVVRKTINDGYEIIAGERRWRAAQIAGLDKVPVVIREIPDESAIAMSLIENIQREELNPIEEANALQRLITEFNLTHQEAADAVGRSRTAVTNLLRLQKLSAEVSKLVEENKLEMGHARALLALDAVQQTKAANTVVARDLSVRQTESLVRRILNGQQTTIKNKPKLDPDVARLQNTLSEKLGAAVVIQHDAKGKGKLIIRYNNLDELDGILEHIE